MPKTLRETAPHRTTETDIKREIMDALNRIHGVVLWKNQTGSRNSGRLRFGLCKGSSDLIGMINERFLAVEVKKSSKDKPTEDQLEFLRVVNDRGGLGFICWSVDDALEWVYSELVR